MMWQLGWEEEEEEEFKWKHAGIKGKIDLREERAPQERKGHLDKMKHDIRESWRFKEWERWRRFKSRTKPIREGLHYDEERCKGIRARYAG